MLKALKTGIKSSHKLEVLQTVRKPLDSVCVWCIRYTVRDAFSGILENWFVRLRPNYGCLGAQCIKCYTNAYFCTHTRLNLLKNYSQMIDLNVLNLLQILTRTDEDNDYLMHVIFSDEAIFHTCGRYNVRTWRLEHPHVAIKHEWNSPQSEWLVRPKAR